MGKGVEGFYERQVALLEQVASGASLDIVLDGIVHLIEAQPGGTLCSILLVEDGRVRHVAAPHLPSEYTQALDGATIGPEAGSCGRAAYLGECVVVEDIATHPYWAPYRHLALPHGLRACWSTPIWSRDDEVLGTFAMYYREPRRPTEEEKRWVAAATHLAAVALAHEQAQVALAAAELDARKLARFYAASNGINEAITRYHDVERLYAEACRIAVNEGVAELAWVGFLDGGRSELHGVASFGCDPEYVAALATSAVEPDEDAEPALRAAREGRSVVIDDIGAAKGSTWAQAALAHGLSSCAAFPLTRRGRAVGVFALYAKPTGVFSAREAGILEALAIDISLAGDMAVAERELEHLVWQLAERVRELTLLHHTARLLESRRPLRETFEDLVQHIPRAWQHRSLCEARVAWQLIDVRTSGFTPTPWMLAASFGDAEEPGTLEVSYREHPAGKGDPFLAEERELLASIANMLTAHLGRRRSELALERSEQRFRAVCEQSPNVYIQWYDRRGRLLHCNKASERLFGVTIDAARGKTLDELNFRAEEARRFGAMLDNVAETGKPAGPTEFEFAQPDGTAGIVLSTVFELPGMGPERCFACMDLDLTEHRRMEEAARREERLRSLVYSSVSDILYCLAVEEDGALRCLAVNPAFAVAVQRDQREIAGKLMDEVFPSEALPCFFAHSGTAIERREPVTWELTWPTPSGPRHGEAIVTPLFDGSGRCTNLVGTIRDITARKRAEEERRKLEQQLQHAQRLQALGTLTGGIAHDFNNVLTAIVGNADLGLIDLDPEHSTYECLTEIRKVTQRAADLVRQILAFSRQQPSTRQPLDVRNVIAEVVRLLRATFPPQIRFEVELPESTPRISADSSQIHQVLMNLCTNAALAIGDKAGSVHISTGWLLGGQPGEGGPPQLVAGQCYAEIQVRDDGCGMDEATLARIFEPFFTTRPQGAGTGLGLSVVHGIVHGHAGAITVDSQLGQGTTFHVYLPATEAFVPAALTTHDVKSQTTGTHILYVDDEEALVFLAQRLLPLAGYRVTGHTDPVRALADFRARPAEFDAVVTDYAMPGLSGPELVREVSRIRPSIPIVMTSGYIRPEDVEAAQRLGIGEVVLKPLSMDDLARVLDQRLKGSATATRPALRAPEARSSPRVALSRAGS